ncbi:MULTISPECIES: hypothetical protein [unclassified Rhodococcus (in: high G+C Gram-positive bacteria)]|uniref:hypothetical protein n=1 Tax=unclassified Rhodococcus (in: high G+C Gram-positive bacteria) TaxID=192944 RepID=UPI001386E0EB|nr:hypothetical protein [Rhodococcus sp. AH-ZY2]NCL73630.1 hypothetical protein [Rhodococcus sp. YH1]NCL78587.1 hypothetical protein [Rhodococcus sp. YH1]WML60867.1 hypothetical protein QNA09_00480 [Rhodococcus sp. AH-ZY2]
MFTALRGRFRTRSTTAHAPTPESHRSGTPAQAKADAAAHTHAQARIETLDRYLGSLTEPDRAEYIAAAQDLHDAMNETGTQDFRACSRGGRPPAGGSVPDGIRSLQDLRALARTIRTSSRPDPTEIAAATTAGTSAATPRTDPGSSDDTDPGAAGQQKP